MPEDQNITRVLSIGSVSKQLEVPPGTVRQWEQDFMLNIPRTPNNVRYYTFRDIELLQKIKKMCDNGDTVETIRQQLKEASPQISQAPSTPEAVIPDLTRIVQDLNERVLRIQQLLETLPAIMKSAVAEGMKTERKAAVKPIEIEPHSAAPIADLAEEGGKLAPDTTRLYVAALPLSEKKKKTTWRKNGRNKKETGKR
ncbi:MerR family transcriptional regulator [Paenibacillus allorhizosphaerae]|nr:MerR family transcriptional regulator [Paenibacillus allorhizosphaerae]